MRWRQNHRPGGLVRDLRNQDVGWTDNIYTVSGGRWYVRNAVPELISCPDGTTAAGLQVYTFYRADEAGLHDLTSTT